MPIRGPEIAHFQHGVSHKTGGSDYFANTTNQTFGIANVWSIACWIKPAINASAERFFEIKATGNSFNRISLISNDTAGGVQVLNFTSAGSAIKNYIWNAVTPLQQWCHVVITWNSPTLTVYFQGKVKTPDTVTTNNAGNMTDSTRAIAFGALVTGASVFTGNLHSMAIWNVALSAAEVASLYNNGNGSVYDCRSIQKSNLQHWWLCDRGDSTRGKDYGFGNATLIDISTNAVLGSAGSATSTDAPRQLIQTTAYPGHKYCLDFDGSVEWMRNNTQTNAIAGIANTWTAMMWVKPTESTFASNRIIWSIGSNSAASGITITHQGVVANDPLRVDTFKSDTSALKGYTWDNLINANQLWQQIVVTWDGTTLLLYSNGTAVAATATPVNNAGAMADNNRIISVAASGGGGSLWLGRMHSAAIWNVVLTAGQITSLYNNGIGWSYDIRLATTGGAQPVHWWLLGDPYYGLSYDRIDSSPMKLIDLSAGQAVNLTIADDSILDAPGL